MHATRIVTFLLGAWIGCCIIVGVLAYQNVVLTDRVMTSPTGPADELIKAIGPNQVRLLLHHFAAEEYRRYLTDWGLAQLGFGMIVIATTYFAVDRRLLPTILAGCMFLIVLFQYFAIAPELAYRGRETDFPPGSLAVGAIARRRAMIEVYAGTEAAKLLIGGLLASYVFSFKSRRRARAIDDVMEKNRSAGARA
ncbi:MAG: hypothetical protein ABL995_01570 [Bryobacteraceae bacterium]